MITLNGWDLTPDAVWRIAIAGEHVALSDASLERVHRAYERLQALGDAGDVIYGVTTGFGDLAPVILPPAHREELQLNLLRSHAAGGGDRLPDEAVRAMSVARLNCLLRGYSGCSIDLLKLMCELLNRRIHAVVPSQGSLGASGDLAPLAHLALPLIGEGSVTCGGQILPATDVLRDERLQPIRLGYKEALALINGTSGMTGLASLALPDVRDLLGLAVLLSADVVSALGGSVSAFDERGHQVKNHQGQIAIASAMRQLLQGGGTSRTHAEIVADISSRRGAAAITDTGVYIQNAYTLRCVPQILGPVLETIDFASRIVVEELNSCNDNPLFFDTAPVVFHGGNFHGQYVAMACDYLNIAVTEIGVLAERQLDRLLSPKLNAGLPAFLAAGDPGLHSGLEGGQYLATSLASENLDLAAPASIKSLPSNGANQDVVSMGMIGARKTLRLVQNVWQIVTCLAVACQQSWYLRAEATYGPILDAFHQQLRDPVPLYTDRTVLAETFGTCRKALAGHEMREWVCERVPIR